MSERAVSPPLDVDVLSQPVEQPAKVAALKIILDGRTHLAHPRPKLGGDHVAKTVTREITKRTITPVHVLQHALAIIAWLEADEFAARRAPGFRQLVH